MKAYAKRDARAAAQPLRPEPRQADADLVRLQRDAGNRAVASVLAPRDRRDGDGAPPIPVQRMTLEEFQSAVARRFPEDAAQFVEWFRAEYVRDEKNGAFLTGGVMYGWDWRNYVLDDAFTPAILEHYFVDFAAVRNTPQAPDPSDDRPWRSYTEEEAAAASEPQRFGVEIECNYAPIKYGPPEGAFYKYAVALGHKPFMRHKTQPFELHLDHLDTKRAKIEIVGFPPQLPDAFIGALATAKNTLLGKSVNAHWFEQFTWMPYVPEEVREHILAHAKGTTTIAGQPVQVTTTHTAKELQKILPETRERFIKSGRKDPVSGITVDVKAEDVVTKGQGGDDFLINEYLANITPLASRLQEGKGSGALVKHAAEQFTRGRGPGSAVIPPEAPVGRIRKDTPYLSGLHTWANKPAPVLKRKGEIAYVVEYRSGSELAPQVNRFLTGKIKADDLGAVLKTYQG